MSRIVQVLLSGALLCLAAPLRAQAPKNPQKTVAGVLATYRQSLGEVDQIRTLKAQSTMFMGGQRAAGVKSWWGAGHRWLRQFPRSPAGQRQDFFGPDGAIVLSGRSRARYRPGDRRTRPYYYVAKALADPFPLLGFARNVAAQAGLELGAANRYDVLALPVDAYGVRTIYLLDQKTGRLVGMRFEVEDNQPFATLQFENHGKVKVGDSDHVVLPYGLHVELRLAVEIEGARAAQERRISFRERVDTWTANPPDLPESLAPPPVPDDLPAGFERSTFATGPEPTDVAVGDLDGDGRNDIAVACVGGLTIHFGGAEDKPLFVRLGLGTHRGCQIVDFDLDGRLDVLTMSWVDPNDTLFLVEFDKARAASTRRLFAAPNFGWDLAVDDFDRDGLPDFVATGYGSRNVSWKFGNGSGGIRFVGTGWPLVKDGRNPERGYGVAVGDMNGDGIRDVAVAEPGRPRVVLFEGQPNLAFHPSAELDRKNVGLVRPVDVHFVDLDGDGRDELVVAQDHPRKEVEGDIAVFLNTGKAFKTLYLAAGERIQCVRSGDIDGDGRIDLLATSHGTDQIAWLRGLGAGKFDKPRFFGAGRGPARLVVADLDGDRRLDFISTNNLDDSICVIRNTGAKLMAAKTVEKTDVIDAFVPGEFRLKGLSEEYEFMGEWRLPLSIRDPSGISFLHGDAVHSGLVLVSDKRNVILRATVDRLGRRLLVAPPIPIRGTPEARLDFEGVSFDRQSGTLFIGCESDSSVIRTTLFGGPLGRAQSAIAVGDNDGIEAVALRRRRDGTPLLYVFKERNGITGRQPPVHVYDIQERPLKLTLRGDPLRVPVALVDQTGAVASDQKLFVLSRFARSIAELEFEGDGFAEKFKVAGYRPLTEKLLGYPKLPSYGMVEGIARAHNGDLFLLVDNNGNAIGFPGKNRGREGRLIWLRNVSKNVGGKAASRVRLRVITVPFSGAQAAPKEAPDRARAKAMAAQLKKRVLAGDNPALLARELKLPRGPMPPGFWLIRPPAVHTGADLTARDLPTAVARLGFSLRIGEVEVCEYDPKESPYGYTVVQRIE